jgi:asparagine synthase (glutamine-hydrolysing)
MRLSQAGLSIVFNGEIYNYLEIKAELEEIGHKFHSTSDTEVILHAWEEWGEDCMDDFNGMFAFIILDEKNQELFAVRDRFGVKPLYYYENDNAIYFASEIKQIRTAPGYKFELNEPIARQYLAIGVTDHSIDTFDTGIRSVSQGDYIVVDLSAEKMEPFLSGWYSEGKNQKFRNFEEAATLYRDTLTSAVNLRLRSDVKVGSCLSGGLDSSSIVCIAADLLQQKEDFAGQETVTACFNDLKYDEWKFAEEVVNKTNAHPHKVFPSFKWLQQDIDKLIWHQDQPFSSTSIFSQWAVFQKTNEVGLKVMIDGQGADEQLAGYGGHDVSMYAGLLRKMKLGELYDEALHYKKEKGKWPVGFLLGALQLNFGRGIVPAKYRLKNPPAIDWLSKPERGGIFTFIATNMVEFLRWQRQFQPLPALLRYEDHNSMAWSVESRTPFMDYRLVELSECLPERYIVKHGVKKRILRHAMHGIIPEIIANRRDKMGFVTPEEMWLRGEGKEWFLEHIDKACKQFGGTLLNAEKVKQYVNDILENRREFDSMPWRIVCFYKWYNQVNGG